MSTQTVGFAYIARTALALTQEDMPCGPMLCGGCSMEEFILAEVCYTTKTKIDLTTALEIWS